MKDDKNYLPKHASISDTQMLSKERIKQAEESNTDNNNLTDDAFWTSKMKLVKGQDKDENKKEKKVKDKKEKKNFQFLYVLLIVIFVLLIGFSLYKIFLWLNDNKKTEIASNKINDTVILNEVEDNDNTTLVGEVEDKNNPYWYYVSFPLIDVDVSKLKKENSDVVGWINVNNTNVNYPFVQTSDNDFYLNHSIDKSVNEAGWLFLDYRNDSNLNNKNSIIYAHSRLDKSMFGSLSKVLKSSWYNNKDNHIIRISLEDSNTLWQIFSVYKIKTESYYITTYFENDNEYLQFLDTITKRSLYDFNTTLNENDSILTLSTCYSETERTVVHAKLIKKEIKNNE